MLARQPEHESTINAVARGDSHYHKVRPCAKRPRLPMDTTRSSPSDVSDHRLWRFLFDRPVPSCKLVDNAPVPRFNGPRAPDSIAFIEETIAFHSASQTTHRNNLVTDAAPQAAAVRGPGPGRFQIVRVISRTLPQLT